MKNAIEITAIGIFVWSFIVFFLSSIDKSKEKRSKYEAALRAVSVNNEPNPYKNRQTGGDLVKVTRKERG